MSLVKALRCRECGRSYKKEAIYVCEFCFGSLEVDYDYEAIKKKISRERIESRPQNMWRYAELLPLDGPHTAGYVTGYTPLIPAENLAKRLGMKKVWIKNDAVCHPTLSFKDRVVGVALSKARELGFDTVACASTGNLANSVAANAAIAKLKSYIFIPSDLEASKVTATLVYHPHLIKVDGNYDEVNRLCAEVAGRYKWAFVNINIRSYYAEGSKTHGFEIVEQLGWKYPDNIVVPIASGSLMSKIHKSFREFQKVGLMKGDTIPTKFFGAQAEGCSPVIHTVKDGSDIVKPVKPKTICKSLAIGNPADGYYAVDTIRQTGGWGENPNDEEIVDAILLLAEEEGIYTETAGGTTMAAALRLITSGKIKKDESVVICITGNGLKTSEVVTDRLMKPMHIKPSLASFEDALKHHKN